jgi:hypothetical protein
MLNQLCRYLLAHHLAYSRSYILHSEKGKKLETAIKGAMYAFVFVFAVHFLLSFAYIRVMKRFSVPECVFCCEAPKGLPLLVWFE